jgi:hypothetical protein
MSPSKRLWTDEEIMSMPKTIELLRRMRSAAVSQPSIGICSKKALTRLFGGQEQIYSQQEALTHAEEIANAAGDFFAAKLSKTTRGNREFEKWQDLLHNKKRQYKLYGPTTYAKTDLGEVVGNSVISRMRNLDIDANHMLTWDLLENNNLGATTICELVDQDIGVISPLSGDYLMARIYSSYLQRKRGKSFPVRAIALTKDLSVVNLPTNTDDSPVFEDKSAIGIYIDTNETGNTARKIFKYLNQHYPQKTIHPPKFEKVEFVPSKKIERWRNSNSG